MPTMTAFIIFALFVATATARNEILPADNKILPADNKILPASNKILPASNKILAPVSRVVPLYKVNRHNRIRPLIVNGTDAEPAEWPWQASLQYKRGKRWFHFCGGSLVAKRWVVTAAHCVKFMGKHENRVVLGEHTLSGRSGHEQIFEVDEMYYHGHYKPDNLLNDIALIRLEEDAELNEYVQIVPMARPGESFTKTDECYISGWGLTEVSPNVPANVLQEVQMDILSTKECKEYWGENVRAGMICVRHRTGDASACMGDSGGPLVCRKDDSDWTLVGATSWGSAFCLTELPEIYSSISYFYDWLVSTMKEDR